MKLDTGIQTIFIVGNANEIIDVSIAAINIISMSAITVMIDLRFIKTPFIGFSY